PRRALAHEDRATGLIGGRRRLVREWRQDHTLAGLGVFERDAARKAGLLVGDITLGAMSREPFVVEREQMPERRRIDPANTEMHDEPRFWSCANLSAGSAAGIPLPDREFALVEMRQGRQIGAQHPEIRALLDRARHAHRLADERNDRLRR